MPEISALGAISGVKVVDLTAWADDRGAFLETFRKAWFPERSWDALQANCSYSRARVLRGLHYHHRQVDYWFVPHGRIRVALADLRRGSPTRGASATLDLGKDVPRGVLIPVGVAHGFAALSDAVLTYLVDNYHDGTDEHGVAWDDPAFGLDWGVADPIVSARDRGNPRLGEIREGDLPE